MLIALYAAVAMFVQDILSTMLVQAEARNRAHLAGLLDSLAWVAAISTTTLSVSTLEGHDFGRQVVVVIAVSAANYFGTVAGTKIGARWLPAEPTVVPLRAKPPRTTEPHPLARPRS